MKNIRLLTAAAHIVIVIMMSTGFSVKAVTWNQPDTDTLKLAYPFSLQDSEGREVRASDFKGKLMVLEFWFTGCVPCIALARSMEPVVDYFDDREDIVFVSINLDRDRERWLNSLQNGAMLYGGFNQHVDYVHPKAISLSTQPLGFEHLITNYYGIRGAPALIIVGKEGEILNRNPLRPGLARNESVSEFITLLESYLAKPMK